MMNLLTTSASLCRSAASSRAPVLPGGVTISRMSTAASMPQRSVSTSSGTTLSSTISSAQANAAVVNLAANGDWIVALCCLRGTEALGLRSSSQAYYAVLSATGRCSSSWIATLDVVRQLSLTQTSAAALARTAVTAMAQRDYDAAANIVSSTKGLEVDPWCAAMLLYHARDKMPQDAFEANRASRVGARAATVLANTLRATRPGVSLPHSLLYPALLSTNQVGDWATAAQLAAICDWPSSGGAADSGRRAMILCSYNTDAHRILATALNEDRPVDPAAARDVAVCVEGLLAARRFDALARLLVREDLRSRLRRVFDACRDSHRVEVVERICNVLVAMTRRVEPANQRPLLEAWCCIAPKSAAPTAVDVSWQSLERSATWSAAFVAARRSMAGDGPAMSKLGATALLNAFEAYGSVLNLPSTSLQPQHCVVRRAIVALSARGAPFVEALLGPLPTSLQPGSSKGSLRAALSQVKGSTPTRRSAMESWAVALREFDQRAAEPKDTVTAAMVLELLAHSAERCATQRLFDLAGDLLLAWATVCDQSTWDTLPRPPLNVALAALARGARPALVQVLIRTVASAALDSKVRSYITDFGGDGVKLLGEPSGDHSLSSALSSSQSTLIAGVAHWVDSDDDSAWQLIRRYTISPEHEDKLAAALTNKHYMAARRREADFLGQLVGEARSGNRANAERLKQQVSQAELALSGGDRALLMRGERCGERALAAAALVISKSRQDKTRASQVMDHWKLKRNVLVDECRSGLEHRARVVFCEADSALDAPRRANAESIALKLLEHEAQHGRLTLDILVDAIEVTSAAKAGRVCGYDSKWAAACTMLSFGPGAVRLAREAMATPDLVGAASSLSWAVGHAPSWVRALTAVASEFGAVENHALPVVATFVATNVEV